MTFFTEVCFGHFPTNIIIAHNIPSCLVKIYFIFVFPFKPISSKMYFPQLSSDSIICMPCKINKNFYLCVKMCVGFCTYLHPKFFSP